MALGPWRIHAHALLASGRLAEALGIYRTLLQLDGPFGGLLSRNLYREFRFMEQHGITLGGLGEYRAELAARLSARVSPGNARGAR